MSQTPARENLRPPAVPLVTSDPYFSIWSFADRLSDDVTRHWTGAPQALGAMVRVDGRCHRIMGGEPAAVPALEQVGLEVLPLRSAYTFVGAGVQVRLTFMTPMLPDDLEVLARPTTYLTWQVQSVDGRSHAVALYFDAAATLAVDTPEQNVIWSRLQVGDGIRAIGIGAHDQRILGKSGDRIRIDWGFFYCAAPPAEGLSEVVGDQQRVREAFVRDGRLPSADDTDMPRRAEERRGRALVMALAFDLGAVRTESVTRHMLLAYDDVFSIEYLNRRLRPYWRRHGAGADALIRDGLRDYDALVRRCAAFDAELMHDMRRIGGPLYAHLGALAFRQCLAAQKLVADVDGTPLLFSKENDSNGCVATVDVAYPTSPLLLLFNPDLLAATLRPILAYARLPRWRHAFAPHDLGTYPLANGQRYGGGEETEERQMPIEECGNLLLLAAALAEARPDEACVQEYRTLLDSWAEYLLTHGYDPDNQLCTDDFAGHLAHNTNLSLKAILALAAYGRWRARSAGSEAGERYIRAAADFADQWVREAADGDHFRLAFDRPGTWSQKYNLVWDRLLHLDVLPAEVAQREIAFYLSHLNRFGLPLDSRAPWAKLDWTVWTATLAEREEDFQALMEPLYAFIDQSPDRVPLTDWYLTTDARRRGFQARSVVGGIFIKMLADPALRRKWADRGRGRSATGSSGIPGPQRRGRA